MEAKRPDSRKVCSSQRSLRGGRQPLSAGSRSHCAQQQPPKTSPHRVVSLQTHTHTHTWIGISPACHSALKLKSRAAATVLPLAVSSSRKTTHVVYDEGQRRSLVQQLLTASAGQSQPEDKGCKSVPYEVPFWPRTFVSGKTLTRSEGSWTRVKSTLNNTELCACKCFSLHPKCMDDIHN